VGQVLVINPGSVGRAVSEDGSTVAEYALLQLAPLDVSLLRVPYGDGVTAAPRIVATEETG
jgi:hypothetical protein